MDDEQEVGPARTSWVMAGAVAVVLAVFGGAWLVTRTSGAPGAPVEDAFPARRDPAIASIGSDHLFLFGGEAASADFRPPVLRNDAVEVSARSGRAVRVPAPPFDPPLYHPAALAVGDHVVVAGIRCASMRDVDGPDWHCAPGDVTAAVYDRTTRGWRTLGTVPLRWVEAVGVTEDGRVLFRGGPSIDAWGSDSELWAVAPGSGGWEHVVDVGSPDDLCIEGDRLVTLERAPEGVVLRAVALGRSATWTTIAEAPGRFDGADLFLSMVCTPGRFVVFDETRPAVAFDEASGTWSALPRDPDRHWFTAHDAVWTGRELLVPAREHGTPALAWDPVADALRELPDAPPFTRDAAIWTGRALVGYATPSSPDESAVYRYIP